MPQSHDRLGLRLDNVLIATDFSAASKAALVFATAVAHRHKAKLFILHVPSSQSKTKVMDSWRALQTEVTDQFLAGRLAGIEHKLLVETGDAETMLSKAIAKHGIDMVVLGSRSRTGIWKFLLGSSLAETMMRDAPCPVLTVGPNIASVSSPAGPRRILVPTGFAAQSLYAVTYGSWLAEQLKSSLALLHVVADQPLASDEERLRDERLRELKSVVLEAQHGKGEPEYFVEFGPVTEKILDTARRWKADLIVLGVHDPEKTSKPGTAWGKASEIVRSAGCPVLTVGLPAREMGASVGTRSHSRKL